MKPADAEIIIEVEMGTVIDFACVLLTNIDRTTLK